MIAKAIELHAATSEKCFITNSCNFPIVCEPTIEVGDEVIVFYLTDFAPLPNFFGSHGYKSKWF